MTLDYYNREALAWDERTHSIDLRPRVRAFVGMLPAGARVLDAGCGPGRDMFSFLQLGCDVVGFDASSAMVELATNRTHRPVELRTFQEIDAREEFDGIWANASLLHIPAAEIDGVIARLIRALKTGGLLYASVKLGDGERFSHDGRLFCDYTEDSLRRLVERHTALALVSIESSPPGSQQTDGRSWLHIIARRT